MKAHEIISLTEHGRVNRIDVRHEERGRQHEEQEVAKEDVRAPKAELDVLHHELASGLADGMGTETTAIPFASPPSTVGLIVLELAGEEDGYNDLVDRTLDVDDSYETQHRVRDVPKL